MSKFNFGTGILQASSCGQNSYTTHLFLMGPWWQGVYSFEFLDSEDPTRLDIFFESSTSAENFQISMLMLSNAKK